MTRRDVLDAAAKCVCGDREQDYGSPEDNFGTIATFWREYIYAKSGIDVPIGPDDVAIMMALLKVARIAKGNTPDSYIDLAGYAACAGEVATKLVVHNVRPAGAVAAN